MQEYFEAHPEDLAALKRVRHRTAKYEVADKAHLQHLPAYIRKGLRQGSQGPRRTALPQPQQPSKDGELRACSRAGTAFASGPQPSAAERLCGADWGLPWLVVPHHVCRAGGDLVCAAGGDQTVSAPASAPPPAVKPFNLVPLARDDELTEMEKMAAAKAPKRPKKPDGTFLPKRNVRKNKRRK